MFLVASWEAIYKLKQAYVFLKYILNLIEIILHIIL